MTREPSLDTNSFKPMGENSCLQTFSPSDESRQKNKSIVLQTNIRPREKLTTLQISNSQTNSYKICRKKIALSRRSESMGEIVGIIYLIILHIEHMHFIISHRKFFYILVPF